MNYNFWLVMIAYYIIKKYKTLKMTIALFFYLNNDNTF